MYLLSVEIGQGKSGKPGKVREMTLTLEKSGGFQKKSGKIRESQGNSSGQGKSENYSKFHAQFIARVNVPRAIYCSRECMCQFN